MSTNNIVDEKYFRIKFNLPENDGIIDSKGIFSIEYDCELIVDKQRKIHLRVFHDPKIQLGEKVLFWWQNNRENLIEKLEITAISSNDDLKEINFACAYLKGITTGLGNKYYRGNLKFFEIYPSRVELVYDKSNKEDSKFFSNTSFYHLVENQYFYPINWHFKKEEFQWKPTNRHADWIPFGQIEFKPELSFENENKMSERTVTFIKQAILTIKKNELDKDTILSHLSLIEDLFSFYSGEVIDHEISKIQLKDSYIYQVKEMVNPDAKSPHGIFMWQLGRSPFTLIKNIDIQHCLAKQEIISQIISRFNYALKSTGEERFMLHFSILEKLKMEMSENDNSHEYQFIFGKDKTNKSIKAIVKQVADLIKLPEEQEKYRDESNNKVNFLKTKPVTAQLISFLDSLNLKDSDFELDLYRIKQIRDKVFHGHNIDSERDYLTYVNNPNRLPKLVGILILKYLGINDLDSIKKVK